MEFMMILWLIVIIGAVVLESVTYDLVSIFFGGGALVSLILSIIDSTTDATIHWIIQLIVFVTVSLILVLLVRPVTKNYLRRNEIKTNIDAIIGRHGISVDDIMIDSRGTVSLDGVIWTAIASENILANEKIEVLAVEGNKLVVKAIK